MVNKGEETSCWIFVLVAPFPTLMDDIPLNDLLNVWKGEKPGIFDEQIILLSLSTEAAFSVIWGSPAIKSVRVVEADKIKTEASRQKKVWALIPFEDLEPSWKVLSVDQLSPLQKSFDVDHYPLVIRFGFSGDITILNSFKGQLDNPDLLPQTNRDPNKMTILVMTGVTALTRATADRMEKYGNTYPASDIVGWLQDADLTHISNEVAFNLACPTPNPEDKSLLFCSNPKYIELLDFVHANIIEMTGNHMNDFGRDSLLYTISLYHQRGWVYYGAGENLENARQPVTIIHNNNRLAFIGCNPVGPDIVWATMDQAGVANCDFDWMQTEVENLRSLGYLPIVTFQYFESYDPIPGSQQMVDFRRMIDAGAIIVSGSQSHRPQAMEFIGNQFIHYGLGNLFFDQMDTAWRGTRNEVIDRHVFYDGRYISTELLTAILEDYARPRPANSNERAAILNEIFSASGWCDK